MKRPPFLSLSAAMALALGLASDGALAAPSSIPNRSVDIDLKQASIVNVFRFIGDVAKQSIVLDPCVQGTVDLRLQNTPLPLVFDALAMKLGLVYEEDGGTLRVGCQDKSGSKDATGRVSLAAKETALPEVLERLAASAKLEGVDYRATAKPRVNVTLEAVRLSTAVQALSETSNLGIKVVRRRLVVTE